MCAEIDNSETHEGCKENMFDFIFFYQFLAITVVYSTLLLCVHITTHQYSSDVLVLLQLCS